MREANLSFQSLIVKGSNLDASVEHHLLYILETEGETVVQPNTVADNLAREAVTIIRIIAHPIIIPPLPTLPKS